MVFKCQSAPSTLKGRLRLTLHKRARQDESGSGEERTLKGKGPDSASYFTVECSSKGSGGTIIPFQRLRTYPGRIGAFLGGGLAKCAVSVSHFQFPLFGSSL